jgi:hypothetical protein
MAGLKLTIGQLFDGVSISRPANQRTWLIRGDERGQDLSHRYLIYGEVEIMPGYGERTAWRKRAEVGAI